ncbi:histidine--tRNA ligase [Paenibacillus sp. J31TS4]|uniref:histidine--tRNA ligase n=1 Tax=Paenibacillus sp. J31TS4 TaxID=2807195 RepID=UPI001B17A5F4|nr:histidine--tRNA ligase [Paenibacillus sp. J31TS4]GIP39058.1 histidine--tRNA ligase [Paenibacillus sp. J31TS4]
MDKKRIYRPQPLSGFPEWLPEQRAIELAWLDTIRKGFESFGFCSVETPSVEELNVLTAKGEIDKEIYVMQRLHAEHGDGARFGMHYDLTVPFARYVAQHYGELVFPFKRYQIQKVWRGERPQVGRYREFYQCDIDVINEGSLTLRYDAEVVRVMLGIFSELGIRIQFRLNNRKILQGYYAGLGIVDATPIIRIVDKLDKLGSGGVLAALQNECGLSEELAASCLKLASIKAADRSFVDMVNGLGVQSDLLQEGLAELAVVMDALSDAQQSDVVADLSIARGFDYYTGTVFESALLDYPELGSICSGGRYDNLAGSFIDKNLKGVGISIGLTRILGKLFAEGKLTGTRQSPTDVLVSLPSEDRYAEAVQVANSLRTRGMNTEVYPEAAKLAKQIRYASRKGVPYIWFLPYEANQPHEVKYLETGEQLAADPETWSCKSKGNGG